MSNSDPGKLDQVKSSHNPRKKLNALDSHQSDGSFWDDNPSFNKSVSEHAFVKPIPKIAKKDNHKIFQPQKDDFQTFQDNF
jgi:hypothetical protein